MRASRLVRAVAAFVALWSATAGMLIAHPTDATAQTGTSRAVVIVDTGSKVHTSVIQFDGSVKGLRALELAGASPETITYGSLGEAVCRLYGVGDPPVPGQCPGGWAYYRAVGGASGWMQSGLGASNTAVHDGDVEGWKYGGGPPPFSSFCAVAGCAPPPTQATDPPTAPTAAPVTAADGTPGSSGTNPTPSGSTAGSSASGTTAPGDPAATTTPTTGAGTSVGGVAVGQKREHSPVEIAAGPGTGGSDSGSPTGVIVAGVVLAVGAGAAVWFRRRRQGPAPG